MKYYSLILFSTLYYQTINAQEINMHKGNIGRYSIDTSYLFGSSLAITFSWDRNKSKKLAIVHGFLSWIYVLYILIKKEK